MELSAIYFALLLVHCAAHQESFAQYFELLFPNETEWNRTKEMVVDLRKCYEDMVHVLRHLDSKWAIQMADSFGKVPSGALLGNGLWMGKYGECTDSHATDESGIRGVYCFATWNVTVPTQFHLPLKQLPIKTGLCLPNSCDTLNVEEDFKYIGRYLRSLPLVGAFDRRMHLDSLTCKGKERPISASAQIFLYVVGVYLSLVVVGSSVTVVEYLAERRVQQESPQRSSHVQLVNLEVDDDEEMHGEKIGAVVTSGLSFANGVRFLKCFSAFSNAAKVLDVSSRSAFPCIHGIRFLSMAWVILGHTYVHNLDIVANLMDLLHSVDNLPFQVVIQGTFSVDTFFVLSGFLLCSLYLEESDKRNGNISWMALIFHRLLRISPVYALLVAFNALVFPHLGSGPFWGDHSDAETCQQVWWWNLLYVNNFLDMDDMCLTWTWYLADDFQFFLFGLLLLHILRVWRRPLLCWAVAGSALLVSVAATACISYANDLMPMFAGIASASDYDLYKNRLVRTWDLIYTKSYCRISPYLVGMFLAYRIHGRTDRQPLSRGSKVFGWCGACASCLGVVYGAWFLGEGGAMSHLYNAFSRPMFGVGVAWLLFCCITQNAELVSRFLSWGAWVPLSRLSFCAYLLHPMLMSWYFDTQAEPLHFTHTNWVMLYIAFLVVTYAAAFVVSITFEAPIINIEKMMKQKRTH